MSVTIFGRLLASFFDAQSAPVPVTGSLVFRPRFRTQPGEGALHLGTPATATLDSEGRFSIELVDSPSSWQVALNVKDRAGNRLRFPCFDFLPEPGASSVNFADIVPLADPVTGAPMLRGEDGVGVSAITTAGGELIFTLTNGSETRIPVPQGVPGTGVDTITLQGDELVFALSDGSETRLPAPAGAPGKDAPAPNLAVGEVATLPAGASATAEVTGESPDFVLSLGLPAGANGKTPTITAGTVSTLPAGASATASLETTGTGYTLNLGLPAGAPGANGKDAPTPTLAVGAVSTGTAAASITGTAPNFVLNLTLPAGSKGETGNPSTMTLVGAGRPDNPATLSTANQSAVSAAQVGATFTSTDGAGTGAWAWVKTPTGWAVTYADTGWRDISSLIPAEFKGYTFRVRRIANEVHFYVNVSQQTGVLQNFQFPAGFKLPSFDLQRNLYRGGAHSTVMGSFRIYYGAFHYTGGTSQAINSSSYEVYAAEDPWPATLPGAPANLV